MSICDVACVRFCICLIVTLVQRDDSPLPIQTKSVQHTQREERSMYSSLHASVCSTASCRSALECDAVGAMHASVCSTASCRSAPERHAVGAFLKVTSSRRRCGSAGQHNVVRLQSFSATCTFLYMIAGVACCVRQLSR